MRRMLFLLLLGGCAEPMIRDSDVVRTGTDPAYIYGPGGGAVPTACAGGASGYSNTQPGCQRDLVFAQQVANPEDLVQPRTPGPGPAGPIGRAADRYLNPYLTVPPTGPNTPQRGTPRVIYPQIEGVVPYDPYAGAVEPPR